MAVENALLGLLRREPRHGYELAREFACDPKSRVHPQTVL